MYEIHECFELTLGDRWPGGIFVAAMRLTTCIICGGYDVGGGEWKCGHVFKSHRSACYTSL